MPINTLLKAPLNTPSSRIINCHCSVVTAEHAPVLSAVHNVLILMNLDFRIIEAIFFKRDLSFDYT